MKVIAPAKSLPRPGLPKDLKALKDDLAGLLLSGADADDVFRWLEDRAGGQDNALRLMLSTVPAAEVCEGLYGATPPHDLDVERAVVAMLLCYLGDPDHQETVRRIVSELQADDFYDHNASTIFAAVREGLETGRTFDDLPDLHRWLARSRPGGSYLEQLGGRQPLSVDSSGTGNWEIMPTWLAAVTEVCGAFWSEGLLEWYLRRLRGLGAKRRCIAASWDLLGAAWREEPEEWARIAQQQINATLSRLRPQDGPE